MSSPVLAPTSQRAQTSSTALVVNTMGLGSQKGWMKRWHSWMFPAGCKQPEGQILVQVAEAQTGLTASRVEGLSASLTADPAPHTGPSLQWPLREFLLGEWISRSLHPFLQHQNALCFPGAEKPSHCTVTDVVTSLSLPLDSLLPEGKGLLFWRPKDLLCSWCPTEELINNHGWGRSRS